MHLLQRLRQQVDERAVRVLPHQHGCRGGEQRGVGGRDVGREVDHALAQHQARQEREALDVGIGVVEAHQADVGGPEQALDGARLGGEHEKAGIRLALGEQVDIVGQLAVDQRRRLGGDAVGGQQTQGQAAGAAAGRTDQDALALEVREPFELARRRYGRPTAARRRCGRRTAIRAHPCSRRGRPGRSPHARRRPDPTAP